MTLQESQRAAKLKTLRAELVKQLDRLDFRPESIGPALATIVQHVERTIRRLAREQRALSDCGDLTDRHRRLRHPDDQIGMGSTGG
jgi:hypothetical protein